MQLIGPYRVVRALGSSQAGSVWSVTDADGSPLAVAMLDTAAANDQRWRDAFAAMVNSLAHPQRGGSAYQSADFSAALPWVAYPPAGAGTAERLFRELGLEYHPAAPGPQDADAFAASAAPVSSQPVSSQPTSSQPTSSQPGPHQAVVGQQAVGQQAVGQQFPGGQVTGQQFPGQQFPSQQVTSQQVTGQPVSGQQVTNRPVSAQPVSSQPVSVQPVSGRPVSGRPVSGEPVSGSAYGSASGTYVSGSPAPVSGPGSGTEPSAPVSGWPSQYASGGSAATVEAPDKPFVWSAADPVAEPVAPGRRIVPSAPRRSRKGLWIGLGAAALVLVLVGVVVAVMRSGGDTPIVAPTIVATTSAAPAPPPATSQAPPPPPAKPGLEPPKAAPWPGSWPKLVDKDQVRTISELPLAKIAVKIPITWRCRLARQTADSVTHYCGRNTGTPQEVGGEITVRTCPDDCPQAEQTKLRKAEEAWGLQWMRSGRNATYAEKNGVDIAGRKRYAVAVVAYYRGTESSFVDRQIAVRMTAPVGKPLEVRYVVNYLRDSLIF